MRKYRLCLLVILIAFCIQGCSKQQDVEDHSFVLAMGFERINEKKLLVRYSYADFDKVQSDSGTKIPSRSVTVLATSLKDANKKWKQYKSQQLNFGHLKVVIFGNGKKNVKIIKELVEEPQIAKSVYVLKSVRYFWERRQIVNLIWRIPVKKTGNKGQSKSYSWKDLQIKGK